MALDPFAAVLYAKLSDVVERLGRRDEALALYLRACELDYYRATYHLEAGRLALLLGQKSLGAAHLRVAIALFPAWIDLTCRRQGADSLYTAVLEAADKDARAMLLSM